MANPVPHGSSPPDSEPSWKVVEDTGGGLRRWRPQPPDADPDHPLHPYYTLRCELSHATQRSDYKGGYGPSYDLLWDSGTYSLSVRFEDKAYNARGKTIEAAVDKMRAKLRAASTSFTKAAEAEARWAARGTRPRYFKIPAPGLGW